jgi:hypothetical protein
MTWSLPDGLPPGQFIAPDPAFSDATPDDGLWITDEPVPDAGEVWARVLRRHEDTGLWPLLTDRSALSSTRRDFPARIHGGSGGTKRDRSDKYRASRAFHRGFSMVDDGLSHG